jgi:hypothetical protein
MHAKKILTLALTLVVLTGLVGWGAGGQVSSRAAPVPTLQHKWEYTLYTPANKDAGLSHLRTEMGLFGVNGWELVSTYVDSAGRPIFVFKRPQTN